MSYTYEQRKRPPGQTETAPVRKSNAVHSAMTPAAAQSAHRVDLPDAMRAKMESAFGADLSDVKLYESQAVADAGAEAVTQGSSIAFAPGKLDFASSGGQSLLGHELSHVVSQARGGVTGSGFLNDQALEARADREGAMAAAGQQVYSGPVTGALSSAAPAVSAAAPMQAKRKSKEEKRQERAQKNVDRLYRIQAGLNTGMGLSKEEKAAKNVVSAKDSAYYDDMTETADYDTIQEIDRRGKLAAKQLVDLRGQMQGDDSDKLDYDAAWSAPSLDLDIYNNLFAEMSQNSPGGDQYAKEIEQKKLNKAGTAEDIEDMNNKKIAAKITDANFLEAGKKNSYLMSPEGQEDYKLRAAEREQRFREIYLGNKKKKKK